MRTSIAAFALGIAGSLPAAAADPMQTCKSGPTFESRIMACSEVIDARNSPSAARITALGTRGQHLARIRQWEAALADLDQAISLGSRDPEVFDARGRTLAEAASLDHAARDFEQAVSLDPASPRYLLHRSTAYAAMGDAARARQDLERARTMDAAGALRQVIEEALAALAD